VQCSQTEMNAHGRSFSRVASAARTAMLLFVVVSLGLIALAVTGVDSPLGMSGDVGSTCDPDLPTSCLPRKSLMGNPLASTRGLAVGRSGWRAVKPRSYKRKGHRDGGP